MENVPESAPTISPKRPQNPTFPVFFFFFFQLCLFFFFIQLCLFLILGRPPSLFKQLTPIFSSCSFPCFSRHPLKTPEQLPVSHLTVQKQPTSSPIWLPNIAHSQGGQKKRKKFFSREGLHCSIKEKNKKYIQTAP